MYGSEWDTEDRMWSLLESLSYLCLGQRAERSNQSKNSTLKFLWDEWVTNMMESRRPWRDRDKLGQILLSRFLSSENSRPICADLLRFQTN